jgi:hypothetical protein
MAKVGPAISIFIDDLIGAIEAFPDGVATCAERIRGQAEEAINRETAKTPPRDPIGLKIVSELALTMLAAVVTGMYQVDCEWFSAKIVDFVVALVGDPRKRDRATTEVLAAQTRFLRAMLCFMDGRRCEENFHWMFCVWPFRTAEQSIKLLRN